jgi:hypothetical protein
MNCQILFPITKTIDIYLENVNIATNDLRVRRYLMKKEEFLITREVKIGSTVVPIIRGCLRPLKKGTAAKTTIPPGESARIYLVDPRTFKIVTSIYAKFDQRLEEIGLNQPIITSQDYENHLIFVYYPSQKGKKPVIIGSKKTVLYQCALCGGPIDSSNLSCRSCGEEPLSFNAHDLPEIAIKSLETPLPHRIVTALQKSGFKFVTDPAIARGWERTNCSRINMAIVREESKISFHTPLANPPL